MKTPQISIIIVTLNNGRTIENCVQSIKMQDYPQSLIEYLNVDGGSTDKTVSILRRYGFETIDSPIKRNAEAQRAIGLRMAKNDLIVSLDADNYLPDKNWLKQMLRPFMDDSTIIHAGTMHFTYRQSDSFYNRYCALFGGTDPVVFYVGRPDRLPQNVKRWTRGHIIKETKTYYIVEFDKETLPTVGCNGVVYRKNVLLKYAKSSPAEFLHIDVFADLIDNGFNRFAIVKNDVIHDTALTLRSLIKKRIAFLSSYYLRSETKRRYLIYNSRKTRDNLKLSLFIIYTLTFIKPLFDSLRGYIFVRDLAWFAHPAVCCVYLYSYFLSTIKSLFIRKS